ncbi:MAG TPA: AAA family ATPase, partial [Burkholderiales bacterium]|nr:AAA family ATPase [Burkholderiales bacterium]
MSEVPQHNVKQGTAGQRRHLTILFSDLSDSTRLSGQMDQEDYAELLEALRKLFRKIIPAHGGQIVSIQGDGVLAIFGYPEVRENDARRATEAALDLHAAVRALEVPAVAGPAGPLELHSGIHAGLVYLSPGDVELGRFALGGEVSNTAARLSADAGRGEIYISAETLGPDVQFFSVGERSVRSLKGRAAPLAVFRILGRAPAQSRFRGRSAQRLTPFVGRDGELASLREEARAAAGGGPRCVLVTGDPGLGKTRLVEELLRDECAAPFRILRGYCESDLAAEPLQPFVQMLRSVCGIRPGMSAAQAAASAESALAAVPLPSGETRGALMQALSLARPDAPRSPVAGGTMAALHGLFDALAGERPLLLLVDDLQWADDSSRQMLYAIQALRRPLLLLLVSRGDVEDAPPQQAGRTIVLAPLAREAAVASIRHLVPGADPFVVDDIYRDGGGNPLFIEELCHSAAADKSWRRESRAGGAGWLSTLIESRIVRLAPEQAEVLRAAAVIGNAVPAWLLGRITGFAEDHPTVRALAEHDFLFPAEQTGAMRFKHGITREVVYDSIGLRARKQLHGAISAALAERYAAGAAPAEGYEILAYHYAAAGLSEQTARFAELAGDKAMAALALDRAQAQYAAALAALDTFVPLTREVAQRWCGVAQKLGMACVFDTLALPNGLALFERAVALARQAGDLEALARAEYWLGYVSYARGLGRQARTHCEASLALCERIGEQRLLAQV